MKEIRNLEESEIEESLMLSSFAFQVPLSKEMIEKKKKSIKVDTVWGVFVDQKLTAKLRVLPLKIYFEGKEISAGGIASVATWPEYRRKGYVKQLLIHTLQIMKDRGQLISLLAPFSFDFYRKYGWMTYVDLKKYTIDIDYLKKVKGNHDGTIHRVDKSEWKLLNEVYEEFSTRYNGMLKRDKDWWVSEKLVKSGEIAVYFNKKKEPKGYIYYEVAQRVMNVHEFLFNDEESREMILHFIANHDSMVDQIKLNAPINDQLSFLLVEPTIGQEIVPYFMSRIVDVVPFFKQYPFKIVKRKSEAVIYIHVRDPILEWNCCSIQLNLYEDGNVQVSEIANMDTIDMRFSVHCSISTLTGIFMGYQRALFLRQIGLLEGEEKTIKKLEEIIPQRSTYLVDYF